jgi:hypothetical protein
MSIRTTGPDAPPQPIPVAGSGPTAPTAPVAPAGDTQESHGLSPGPRDGVDAPHDPGIVGNQLSTPDARTLTGAVGVSDVLRELTGPNLASDPGLRSLPPSIQDRILAAVAHGPPGLAETFKRLANSPNFRKLSPDIQAKIVDLLAKVAGNANESQAVERLVRSSAFAALPEKEQAKMLANISKANDGNESRDRSAAASRSGLGNLQGGEVGSLAALFQVATLLEAPGVQLGGSFDAIPVDPNASNGALAGDMAARSPYADVKRLIAQLRAAPELTPATIGRVLGVILSPASRPVPANGITTAAASAAWIAHEGRPTEGPFQRVELRESITLPWRLVNLEVRPDLELGYHEFRGDLIPVSIAPQLNPDIAPDGELSFRLTDERPKQDIRFGFGARAQQLRSASIHRHFG